MHFALFAKSKHLQTEKRESKINLALSSYSHSECRDTV
jgi:hypothetical protein